MAALDHEDRTGRDAHRQPPHDVRGRLLPIGQSLGRCELSPRGRPGVELPVAPVVARARRLAVHTMAGSRGNEVPARRKAPGTATVGWVTGPSGEALPREGYLPSDHQRQPIERAASPLPRLERVARHLDDHPSASGMGEPTSASPRATAGPHVSNDNPFSESQFRTMKYRPTFLDRFGCFEDAHTFCGRFFGWCNDDHRHSGIGFHTPADVHYERAARVREQRALVLNAAYAEHPERFVRNPPEPPRLPTAVWINEPKEEDQATTQ